MNLGLNGRIEEKEREKQTISKEGKANEHMDIQILLENQFHDNNLNEDIATMINNI